MYVRNTKGSIIDLSVHSRIFISTLEVEGEEKVAIMGMDETYGPTSIQEFDTIEEAEAYMDGLEKILPAWTVKTVLNRGQYYRPNEEVR